MILLVLKVIFVEIISICISYSFLWLNILNIILNNTFFLYFFFLDITPQKRGRPQKIFTQSSERIKRRKTKDLRSNELAELTYATQMKLRESGKAVASNILKDLQKSPTRAKKYKAAYKRSSEEPPRQLSALIALSMIADAGLSREQ